jgi:hypothetical protein
VLLHLGEQVDGGTCTVPSSVIQDPNGIVDRGETSLGEFHIKYRADHLDYPSLVQLAKFHELSSSP